MAGSSSEKTEKPTAKRRRDERKKGNVLMSKDAVAVATLLASYVSLKYAVPHIIESMTYMMEYSIGLIGTVPTGGANEILKEIMNLSVISIIKSVGIPLLLTAIVAIVVTFAQTRMLITFDMVKPKFSKLNPINGLKNFFSLSSLVDIIKNIIKITILICFVYYFMKDSLVLFAQYLTAEVEVSLNSMMDLAFGLVLKVAMAFGVLAFFDFLYQRWNYERQLMMTKEEVKEEFKQMEGDPKIKSKIKQKQRQMALSRMMQAVPSADVVIRNPTHFAVALRYKPKKDMAPVVVAKGQDELAFKIIDIAQQHGVATVENKPLARALYAEAEIGSPIPYEYYGAVADVLVYIYKLNKKLPPR